MLTSEDTPPVVQDRDAEPGDRAPAPGPLAHVQSFVNSVDLEDGREDFDSPQAVHDWLLRHSFLAAPVAITAGDLQAALELREAIRSLLVANAGGSVEPEAVATLNRQAAAAQLGLVFDDTGEATLRPQAAGVAGAFGELLTIIAKAMDQGSWLRLKACRADVCQWAFYDASKNRSGSWCSMAICGNKAKTRSYRARRGRDTT